MNILSAMRGFGGEPEVIRTLGMIAMAAFLLGCLVFTAWNLLAGRAFGLTEWCIAVPGGVGAILGAISGAARVKDTGVANAQVAVAQVSKEGK